MDNKERNMIKAKDLQAKGNTQKEISEKLGVCERTVRNYLSNPPSSRKKVKRKSKLEPYHAYIKKTIEEEPFYNCEILYDNLLKAGYTGKISILRDYVSNLRRETLTEAVIRFETIPGHQAQVDWKEHGKQMVDGEMRKLYQFMMTLGYSRKPFIRFTTSMKSEVLLRCHIDAFKYFGGVPETILYDNMKTAFVADSNGEFQVQKNLMRFASHYGFSAERCRVRRPQTKGKVERSIGYTTTNFWPRVKDKNLGIDSLNDEAFLWIESIEDKRIGGLPESRRERFEKEKQYLKPLPDFDLDIRTSIPCVVNRESCIMYETNKYSVNPGFIGKIVELRVDSTSSEAEIFHDGESIKKIILSASGSRRIIIFPTDKEAIEKRHKMDRARLEKIRNRKSKKESNVDVEIRHPSFYDIVIDMEAMI
jgi:transposase